jgi:hypothetical protein
VIFKEFGNEELVLPMEVTSESFTASNLIPGSDYIIKVAAVNDYDTGPYSVKNITTRSLSMSNK